MQAVVIPAPLTRPLLPPCPVVRLACKLIPLQFSEHTTISCLAVLPPSDGLSTPDLLIVAGGSRGSSGVLSVAQVQGPSHLHGDADFKKHVTACATASIGGVLLAIGAWRGARVVPARSRLAVGNLPSRPRWRMHTAPRLDLPTAPVK